MDANELTGSSNEQNLARILHNALRQADVCAGYALKAETAGNKQLAGFFRDVQKTYASVAERAEEVLGDGEEEHPPSSVQLSSVPVEGDPGDVTRGQNDAR